MDSRVLVILLATLFLLPSDNILAQELNGSTAVSSQELLPASTKAWVSIPDSKRLDEKFLETQLGKNVPRQKVCTFHERSQGSIQRLDERQERSSGIKHG